MNTRKNPKSNRRNKRNKDNQLICSLATQTPGAYTEKEFLQWLRKVDLKSHCDYAKAADPAYKKKPCPSNLTDLAGWMKHYSAKYTTPAACTRKQRRIVQLNKRMNHARDSVASCPERKCSAILKQTQAKWDEVTALASSTCKQSPLDVACFNKITKATGFTALNKLRAACSKEKCVKENRLYSKATRLLEKAKEQTD
jgi:hypothetical protein